MQPLPPNTHEILLLLYQERANLPQDLFDKNDNLDEEFSKHICNALSFVQHEMISFINAPLKDIILYGPAIAPAYLMTSEISIAFVLDTTLPLNVLDYVRRALMNRGFNFKFAKHIIRFYILTPGEIFFPNWSISKKIWNKKPVYQKFPFRFEMFEKSFQKLYTDCKTKLDNLPKTTDGFYTLKSCAKIENYFKTLKEKSFKARQQSEYALNYHLWRALNVFHVLAYFELEINKAKSDEAVK